MGQNSAFSRLAGGIGGRGPGETKLETDRRRVRDKVAQLEKQVEGLRRQRSERRKNRAQKNLPVISLVGYTNPENYTAKSLTQSEFMPKEILRLSIRPHVGSDALLQKYIINDTSVYPPLPATL